MKNVFYPEIFFFKLNFFYGPALVASNHLSPQAAGRAPLSAERGHGYSINLYGVDSHACASDIWKRRRDAARWAIRDDGGGRLHTYFVLNNRAVYYPLKMNHIL